VSIAPSSAPEVNPNLVRCALLRIVVGLLAILTLWDYLGLLTLHFSNHGWYPPEVSSSSFGLSVVEAFTPQVARGAFWACLLSALCLTIGLRSRTAGILTLLGLYGLQLRNSFLTDADDEVLRSTLLVLMFAPVGGFWSFDGDAPRAESADGRWPLRVIRFKVAFLYLASGAEKLMGDTWHGGTAISLALTNPAYTRFRAPPAIEPVLVVFTPIVPYLELALPLLLLPRVTRNVGVALGIAFHLALSAVLELRWFTALVLAHYLAFLSDRHAVGLVQLARWLKRNLTRSPGSR